MERDTGSPRSTNMSSSIDKIDSDGTSDDRSPSSEDTSAAVLEESSVQPTRWTMRFVVARGMLLFLVVISAFTAYATIYRPFESKESQPSASTASFATNSTSSRDDGQSNANNSPPIASNLINVSSPTTTPLPSNTDDEAARTEDEDEYLTKSPVKRPITPPATSSANESVSSIATDSPVSPSPSVSPSIPPMSIPPRTVTRAPTAPPSSAPTAAGFQPIFINAGGPRYEDSKGNIWLNDTEFTTTGVADVGCPKMGAPIAVDMNLYCTGRIHMHGYDIPVGQDDIYSVTLHFYENDSQEEFDVFIEGIQVFRELGEREESSTYFINTYTAISDDSLTIAFVKRVGNVRIAAIEVHKAGSAVFSGDVPAANLSYIPGRLTVEQEGLILSEGLTATLIAQTGRRVDLANGEMSDAPFHVFPDAGATYVDSRPGNVGGWIYVSNSEADPSKVESESGFPGGVGAITFNALGQVIDYRMVLEETRMNCGGGRTPWGSWISGEEYDEGRIYQVDPTGERLGEPITMGETFRGKFESFAYDTRDTSSPRFFMTKDDDAGELRRFTPSNPNLSDSWTILTGPGALDFLVLDRTGKDFGTFQWDADQSKGSASAERHFPGAEGIDFRGDSLYFISKTYKTMFILNLDNGTYTNHTTEQGLFDGQSDQIAHIIDDGSSDSILYFTEDGGTYAGVHGRNQAGQFFTILESHEYPDETTGLSFSPDSKHMYIAYQDNGFLFDIARADGQPFNSKTLNVKFHAVATS